MKAFLCLAALACVGVLRAAEPSANLSTVPLDGVKWAGPEISLDQLHGKTIGVLVYASWCPKCNAWSGELFKQLKQAIDGKPAVILAIYADKSPEGAKAYVTERGFFAPNILHGYDPGMPKKLGFESELFNYVVVDADGKVAKRGMAGMAHGGEAGKKYVMADDLAQPKPPGKFAIIADTMSEPVRNLLWPLELGMGGDAAVAKARGALSADQKKELDAAIERFMDTGLEQIKAGYKGNVEERFAAYDKANQMAGVFRSTAQNKKARDVVAYLEKDEQFKRELAAKKAYDGCMGKGAATGKRDVMLKAVAKRFEGTHYGKLAAETAAKN